MHRSWKSAADWYGERSRREQVLIALAVLSVSGWLFFLTLLSPVVSRTDVITTQLQQQRIEQQRLLNEVTQLQGQLSVDPNQSGRDREMLLQTRNQRLQEQLAQRAQLMPQEQSVRWIQSLLALPPSLELRSFDTLPALPLLEGEQNSGHSNLWQHPIEIRIRGQYFTLRDYVEQLEGITQPFYWQHLSYEVEQYPLAILTLRLYALSADKELLGG